MLDIELLRKSPDKVKEGIKAKKADPALVDAFLATDTAWRNATTAVEELRAKQKKFSHSGGQAPDPAVIEEAKKNKEFIKAKEEEVAKLEAERNVIWLKIPNVPDDEVPRGADESGNVVIKSVGEPRDFKAEGFEPKDHMALGEALGLIDVERAGKVSGTRFAYIKGELARMEFALVQMVFDTLSSPIIMRSIVRGVHPNYNDRPFIPVVPPVMIRPEVFRRMARLDDATADERYYLQKDDMYLVGSAEHTLGSMHMDETLSEEELPLRYIGFSTSFRREAGSYGKDTKGILRVHQFDKLEMESFTVAEDSRKEQDVIVAIQEYLTWILEIPYRRVMICTGDMGGPDARQIDIECWMPGQNQYRETHTSDMNTDYQARRLNTRVKRNSPAGEGKTEFVHMNDATAFAIGRMLIAIMENYQTKEGKIEVPPALKKYMGKDIIG